MSFKVNSLYLTDGYKVGHKAMLAPGTTKLYGTWIPRSIKYAPKGITKIVSFGQQLVWKWIHDEFEENFFMSEDKENIEIFILEKDVRDKRIQQLKEKALQFVKDMSVYLGMEYNGKHFEELWDLGYLPIRVKSLPEGLETEPNIPHMTFINTVDGFAWLTLYLETIVSSLAWKPSTAATIAKLYRRQAEKWVKKTDPNNIDLVDFMCHDFSARGLDPMSQYLIGLGHATSFKGSDTLPVIPAARYFYEVREDEMPIFSVNASEHSCSCTKIFAEAEKCSQVEEQFNETTGMILVKRNQGVCVTGNSGDPVDIICGTYQPHHGDYSTRNLPEHKGAIELLWNIFGGTINEQGYKVLDSHIGAIYGDSITPERQIQIYERLAAKGFAATNIVLGVGSFTYQYNTRDTLGFACKGSWFEIENECPCNCETPHDFFVCEKCNNTGFYKQSYNIYKDPVTDDGTKKSLKGLLGVGISEDKQNIYVKQECTPEEENRGLLQVIYEDGVFYNTTTLQEIRNRLSCS